MIFRRLPLIFVLLICTPVSAQTPSAPVQVPSLGEDRYLQHTYIAVNASLGLCILPAPDNFYFAFVAPGSFGRGQLLQMPITSAGYGAGFAVMPGVDLPISGPYKFLGSAGIRYESVSHTEVVQQKGSGDQTRNYALSVWSVEADALVRRLFDERFFAQAGFSASYYVVDYFAGSYQVFSEVFNIEQQKSKYSYNPQRYSFVIGGGFLVPLVEKHVLSVALNARIALSQLFYGVTSADYDNAKVAQAKLWGIDIHLSYNIPFGAQRPEDSRPAE